MSKQHLAEIPSGQKPVVGASILVILMGALGDVARGLVIVDQLKRSFPGGRVSWLVEPKCEELVRLHPRIDRVIVYRRGKGIVALRELWRELRREKFDVAIDLQRHFKSGVFSFCSAAPRRLGFHPRNAKEFNWVFNTEYVSYLGEDVSKLVHYLSFMRSLGAEVLEPYDFGFSRPDLPLLPPLDKLLNRPYLVAVLGSSWESKNWFIDGYAQICAMLQSRGSHALVLVGDKRQSLDAEQLRKQFPGLVHNLVGQTSLADLLRIVAHADVAFGPDSGPGHVAAALKTPYVSLFGPTSPKRVAPYAADDLVVHAALGCMPCARRVCPGLGKLCMRLISAELVFEKIEQALLLRTVRNK